MGIYDREYYRRSTPSFLGRLTERGSICKWLVGANVVFFIVQLLTRDASGEPFTDALLLNVNKVFHGEIWRLLTYAFLHADFYHILFNMLFLWWFGTDVEDLYGPREFLAFYLTSAVAGGAFYCVAQVLGFGNASVVGASGAVTAVLLLCACHYPSRVILLMWIIPVPIWLFLVFSIGQDLYTFLNKSSFGVAVAVHLGGAGFAFLYYKMHWRLTSLWPASFSWPRRRGQAKLRVYRGEEPAPRSRIKPSRDERAIKPAKDVVGVQSAAGPAVAAADEHLEAQMDAILEKISRVGKESLTESELEVLRRASEALKRRRT
jgi:membrane associated rhomboid family serine protease